MVRLARFLERQRPADDQEDLRGFEWHYLWRLAHGATRALQLPDTELPAALSEAGAACFLQQRPVTKQAQKPEKRKDSEAGSTRACEKLLLSIAPYKSSVLRHAALFILQNRR